MCSLHLNKVLLSYAALNDIYNFDISNAIYRQVSTESTATVFVISSYCHIYPLLSNIWLHHKLEMLLFHSDPPGSLHILQLPLTDEPGWMDRWMIYNPFNSFPS